MLTKKKRSPALATPGSCKSTEHLQVPATLQSVCLTDELLLCWMSLSSCREPLDSTELVFADDKLHTIPGDELVNKNADVRARRHF